jgi:hypothetical protein
LYHSDKVGSGVTSAGGAAKAYVKQAISVAVESVACAKSANIFIADTSGGNSQSGKGVFGQQILMAASKIEQVELAGIVPCGAMSESELDAEGSVFVIDLILHSKLVFHDERPPKDGGSRKQQDPQYDHGPCKGKSAFLAHNVVGQRPRVGSSVAPKQRDRLVGAAERCILVMAAQLRLERNVQEP